MRQATKKTIKRKPHPEYCHRPTQLLEREGHWVGRFQAMACDCEILVDTPQSDLAKKILKLAAEEAWRIEHKFSRYRFGNIIDRIKRSQGSAVLVDEETAQLLDFSNQCYEISEGLFDVTSGVLRRIWTFDGSDRLPSQAQVEALLPLIGWHKISWKSPEIRVPEGMEIDLGGIGKEYAVDRIAYLIQKRFGCAVLVNLGGDIAVSGIRKDRSSWHVGIEQSPSSKTQMKIIQIQQGAVATSGDAKRFLLKEGRRYSHILNPITGRPVKNAPHSVTVAAGTCTEAGLLSTLAMLQGEQAESFLQQEDVRYWCQGKRSVNSLKTVY